MAYAKGGAGGGKKKDEEPKVAQSSAAQQAAAKYQADGQKRTTSASASSQASSSSISGSYSNSSKSVSSSDSSNKANRKVNYWTPASTSTNTTSNVSAKPDASNWQVSKQAADKYNADGRKRTQNYWTPSSDSTTSKTNTITSTTPTKEEARATRKSYWTTDLSTAEAKSEQQARKTGDKNWSAGSAKVDMSNVWLRSSGSGVKDRALQAQQNDLDITAAVHEYANTGKISDETLAGDKNIQEVGAKLQKEWGAGNNVIAVTRNGQISIEDGGTNLYWNWHGDGNGNKDYTGEDDVRNNRKLALDYTNSTLEKITNGTYGTDSLRPKDDTTDQARTDLNEIKRAFDDGILQDFDLEPDETGKQIKMSQYVDQVLGLLNNYEEADFENKAIDFLKQAYDSPSGLDTVATQNVADQLQFAQNRLAEFKEGDAGYEFWDATVEDLTNLYTYAQNRDNRAVFDDLQKQLSDLKNVNDTLSDQILEIDQSVNAASGVPIEDALRLRNEIEARQKENEAKQKEIQEQLAQWQPNTNEEREALVAKMHANAGFMRGGLTAEEQARLLELDAELMNPNLNYGKDFVRRGAAALGWFEKAAGHVNKAATKAVDWLLGDLFDEFTALINTTGQDLGIKKDLPNVIKSIDKWVNDTVAADEAYFGTNVAGSRFAQVIDKYGTMTAEAIPMYILARLTGGASLTSEGLTTISSLEQSSGFSRIAQIVATTLRQRATDPNFQYTFVQGFGQSYEEALADGADQDTASVFALLNAWTNASIEIEGGIQGLPDALKGDEDALLAYAKSIVEEIGEEWRQNSAEKALKSLYRKPELFSIENEDAIINPKRMVEEGIGAGVVAAILGAPDTAIKMAKAPKGVVTVDEKGRIISAPSRTTTPQTGNRHAKVVGTLAEGADVINYGAEFDADEAYNKATSGDGERLPSADGSSGKAPGIENEEAPEDKALTQEEIEEQLRAEQERETELNEEGLAQEEASYDQSFEDAVPEEPERGIDTSDVEEGIRERKERELEEDRVNSLTEENNSISASQNQTIEGQEIAAEKAVESEDLPVGPETARSEEQVPAPTETALPAEESVKPSEEVTEQAPEVSKASQDVKEVANRTQQMLGQNATAVNTVDESNPQTWPQVDSSKFGDLAEGKSVVQVTRGDSTTESGKQWLSVSFSDGSKAYYYDYAPVIDKAQAEFKNNQRTTEKAARFAEVQRTNKLNQAQTKSTATASQGATSRPATTQPNNQPKKSHIMDDFDVAYEFAKHGGNIYGNQPIEDIKTTLDVIRSASKSNPIIWEEEMFGVPTTYAFDGETFEVDGKVRTSADDLSSLAAAVDLAIRKGLLDPLSINQQSGTIENTGMEANVNNDNTEYGQLESGTGTDQESSGGGTSSPVQDDGLIPKYTGEDSERARRGWEQRRDRLKAVGAPIVARETVNRTVNKFFDFIEKLTGSYISAYDASKAPANLEVGFHDRVSGSGLYVSIFHNAMVRIPSSGRVKNGPATAAFHEAGHYRFSERGPDIKRKDLYEAISENDGVSSVEYAAIHAQIIKAYGLKYAKQKGWLKTTTQFQWEHYSESERKAKLDSIPESTRNEISELLYEETLVFANSNDCRFDDYKSYPEIVKATREAFIANNLFSTEEYNGIDEQIAEADEVAMLQKEAQGIQNAIPATDELSKDIEFTVEPEIETEPAELGSMPPQDTTIEMEGSTPGTIRESSSALGSRLPTKGEDAASKQNKGPTTFVSRTNADRSRTADFRAKDQKHRDAWVKHLMNKESWNDDDVVLVQKLLYDMTMGIRDFQMHMKKRMSESAFKTMTEQYNNLFDRYKKEKSAAAQELQARYEFTLGQQITMKAAHTFLGFTEDGRFAGGAPNAKNARVYAAIEDAANRIDKAVKNEDAQALAQICKDISVMRNTKKKFGRLGNFASNLETKMLEKLTTTENGLQLLEKLAYGNLNAVNDDVQPYKAINAAKTIRVMNMLSNLATINNNIGNNIMQGYTGSNIVGQAATRIASKAFENLTGQKVISSNQRGWVANREIRNAEWEALQMATLAQMYGVGMENGRIELKDQGMFNPNANPFEQMMSTYKFLIGMGVEATDQVKAAGLLKSMEMGIDKDIAAGKINPEEKEARMKEARHEVNRLLYKDDNALTAFVQHARDFLNRKSIGNARTGTIGLGDITMAFAKIPANVVRARLLMTPEGALYSVVSYAKGVAKAKRMHAEVLAKNIAMDENLSDSQKWAMAREQCSGYVYKNLATIRDNYSQQMTFEHAVERAGYMEATEMSQFEMAQNARKIGRAATSVGMMVLGSLLRGLGALRDFDEEPDDQIRKMNSEKGYRGLMINFSAIGRKDHEWKDGDKILDAEWLECIAMPLAIGATAAECAATAEDLKTWHYFKSIGYGGLGKAFEAVGDIPGMTDAINLYDSFSNAYTTSDVEKNSKLGSGLMNYAANTIPSFFMPNIVSQATAGADNTMRDVYNADTAYEQAWNIFKNKIPKLRETIPASTDVWGEERTYGENKLMGMVNKVVLPGDVFVYHKNEYEQEIERLIKAGYTGAAPRTTTSKSFDVGEQTFTMDADEYREFRTNRNKAEAMAYKAFMDSDWYQKLDDGQREAVLKSLKTSAERDAKQDVLNTRGDSTEVTRDKWETTLVGLDDQIQYLSAKNMFSDNWDKEDGSVVDFKAMDKLMKDVYSGLPEDQRKLLDGSLPYLDQMNDARQAGIDSEHWQIIHNIYSKYNAVDEEGKNIYKADLVNQADMWAEMQEATGYADNGDEMKWATEGLKLWSSSTPNTENYDELIDEYGFSREGAAKVYRAASGLENSEGYETLQNSQKWNRYTDPEYGLSDAEQWDAYFAMISKNSKNQIAQMKSLRSKVNPRTLKPYTFKEAINTVKDSRGNPISTIYRKEILPNGKTKYYPINR